MEFNKMIKFRNESNNEIFYATKYSHGFDVCSVNGDILKPGETKLIKTGLYLEVDIGKLNFIPDIQIRPRSSLSSSGILGHTGTIDIDYRGEIKVCLTNLTNENFNLFIGYRIAQIVIGKAAILDTIERRNIERGIGGFGSTGR
jgi:dUTP pyrophosphatase